LGEVPTHFVDQPDVLRREWHAWSRDARAHADGNVELDALRVERIELRVVDRHLRAEAGRKRSCRLHSELFVRAPEVANAVHSGVGVDLEAAEEAIRMLL